MVFRSERQTHLQVSIDVAMGSFQAVGACLRCLIALLCLVVSGSAEPLGE